MKSVLRLFGLVLVLLAGIPAFAADVAGTWKGTFDGPGGQVPVTLNLMVAGAAVTGTMDMAGTPTEIHDGKVEGDEVSFWLNSDYQGQTYKLVYRGTVKGDQVDFSFGTEDGAWGTTMTLKRDGAGAPGAGAANAGTAAAAASVTGDWTGSFDVQGNPVQSTFHLKSDGPAVTGNITGMGPQPVEIHDGKLDGDTLTFWVNAEYQGQTYKVEYKGKVSAAAIDFSLGTSDGSWGTTMTAKKA